MPLYIWLDCSGLYCVYYIHRLAVTKVQPIQFWMAGTVLSYGMRRCRRHSGTFFSGFVISTPTWRVIDSNEVQHRFWTAKPRKIHVFWSVASTRFSLQPINTVPIALEDVCFHSLRELNWFWRLLSQQSKLGGSLFRLCSIRRRPNIY